MTSRLMDLVLLLAELSQNPEVSREELDRELQTRGYSSQEIDQAIGWILKKREGNLRDGAQKPRVGTVRVLSEWERLSLGEEAHRFLLRLYHLGLIDGEQLEAIVAQVATYQSERVDLQELKSMACALIFSQNPAEYAEDPLEDLEDGTDFN